MSGIMSSFASTRIMIGRWRGCASDHAFTSRRQSTKGRQGGSKLRSWRFGTLERGGGRVDVGIACSACGPAAAREEPAVRVGEDVDLDLPDALGLELHAERVVRVLPRLEHRREVEQSLHQLR